jgi:hypothetical protein
VILLLFFTHTLPAFFFPMQLDRSDSFLRRIVNVLVHGLLGVVDNFLLARVLLGEISVPN